jgi:hypothetical protein
MGLRFFAIGALAAWTVTTASSALAPARPNGPHLAAASGSAHLVVVGSRSAAQRSSAGAAKMDSILADLARHAALARPGHLLEDLHSLSPAARFAQGAPTATPLVSIDAVTRGDPERLKSALLALGLQRAALYSNDVGGWLPVNQIESAAALGEIVSVRAAMPRTRASGPVATQGDYAQASSVVRADYPTLTGKGITVGVLSDSFDCYAVYAEPGNHVPVSGNQGYASNGFTADYATDVSTGALPSGVSVLAEPYTSPPSSAGNCLAYGAPTQLPFSDEGRAMLQIVHAVAPGASLAFYTAEDSEADFASGIGALAAAGANVIADDVGYFDEPFFQDGIVAQAVDAVEAKGVAYFSAAGNDGTLSYENMAPSFATTSTGGANAGELLLNFDTTGATNTTALPVTIPPIPPGDFLAVVVEWDQPYVTGAPGSPGASSSIDLCISGGTGSDTITDYDGNAASCTGLNAVGADPYQIMIIGNPANAAGNSRGIRAPPALRPWAPPSISIRRAAVPRPQSSSISHRPAVRRFSSTPRARASPSRWFVRSRTSSVPTASTIRSSDSPWHRADIRGPTDCCRPRSAHARMTPAIRISSAPRPRHRMRPASRPSCGKRALRSRRRRSMPRCARALWR